MYDNAECNQFVEDMEGAGFEVFDYGGRGGFHGPAARVDREREQEAIRATSIRLRTDNLGMGLVMYPCKSGDLVDD